MRIDRSSKAIVGLLFILILIVGTARYSNEIMAADEMAGDAGALEIEGGHAFLLGQRLDANTATAEDFALLPGIGKVKARALIEKREEMGGFKHIEDLLMVKGIGSKISKKLEKWLRFDSRPAENQNR